VGPGSQPDEMSTAPQTDAFTHTEGPAAQPEPTDLLDTMPWLPCMLTLEIPVVRFTIADLLALSQGSLVETACHHTSDVPLRVNQTLIGWTEFDVIGDRLAVRITEQA
jgi:flagellar motor switch/type III secretory pathway protein FliN